MGKTRKSSEQIHDIFYPRSVAVVGTNKVQGTVPYDIFKNILKDDFQGMLFPVSPREKSICSVKTYKYVIDIPDPVDMAVLVFPSSVAGLAMEQCGQKGIRSMIIISAGFREVGGRGIEREEEVKAIADKYGISFIGPNCLGVINTDPACHFNASFARQMPERGNIAFLSQSGALCTAVLDYALPKRIGFSKFVSFGNKGDVDEVDLIMYLKDDPETSVILLYLEEITDGKALMEAARAVIRETGKPILVLKSGRTDEGASAAASHTGSLAGSDEITDAALAQAGMIRCDDIEQMFNYATALAWQPLPKGNRTAIITNAGGPGVLATDMAVRQGLKLAKFSEETSRVLKKELPATANIKNPVDVIGDARADRYNAAIDAIMQDDGVDSVNVILTPQSMTDIETIADGVIAVAKKYDKPLYSSFMGEQDVAVGIRKLLTEHIPHYILPEDMCRAMAVATGFHRKLEKIPSNNTPSSNSAAAANRAAELIKNASDGKNKYLTEAESLKILAGFDLPVLPHALAASKAELEHAIAETGFPLVMKIMSPDIFHKSDLGGVVLNITDADEAHAAYDRILKNAAEKAPDARIDGILLEKMADRGEEVILGIKSDDAFGPVIMFGLGGVFVEIFRDVVFRVAPLSDHDIDTMITQIKGAPLLNGARGRRVKDTAALKDTLRKLSDLALALPEIGELDINPLFVLDKGKGCAIADAKILLK